MIIDFTFSYELMGKRATAMVSRSSFLSVADVMSEMAEAGYVDPQPVKEAWPKWAWPGAYPICYMTKDGGVLSPDSANEHFDRTLDFDDDQFFIVAQDINWEDPNLTCDHSGERIPCAYPEETT